MDADRIVQLAPDIVIANEEENREPDLAALRAAGLEAPGARRAGHGAASGAELS